MMRKWLTMLVFVALVGPTAADDEPRPVRFGHEIVDEASAFFSRRSWEDSSLDDACRQPDWVAKPDRCDPPVEYIPLAPNRPWMQSRALPGIQAGDAQTQYELGQTYDEGRYMPRDYPQAAYWYGAAARQGHAPAQHQLGTMYEEGFGVRQDDDEAVALYQSSAAQAYEPARRDYDEFMAGRDYLVVPGGGTLFAKAEHLSGYGPRIALPGGEVVYVFDRFPEWARVYVVSMDQWGWMRESELRFRF